MTILGNLNSRVTVFKTDGCIPFYEVRNSAPSDNVYPAQPWPILAHYYGMHIAIRRWASLTLIFPDITEGEPEPKGQFSRHHPHVKNNCTCLICTYVYFVLSTTNTLFLRKPLSFLPWIVYKECQGKSFLIAKFPFALDTCGINQENKLPPYSLLSNSNCTPHWLQHAES